MNARASCNHTHLHSVSSKKKKMMYTCVCVHVCTHVCMYMYMCTYAYIHMCVCVREMWCYKCLFDCENTQQKTLEANGFKTKHLATLTEVLCTHTHVHMCVCTHVYMYTCTHMYLFCMCLEPAERVFGCSSWQIPNSIHPNRRL